MVTYPNKCINLFNLCNEVPFDLELLDMKRWKEAVKLEKSDFLKASAAGNVFFAIIVSRVSNVKWTELTKTSSLHM